MLPRQRRQRPLIDLSARVLAASLLLSGAAACSPAVAPRTADLVAPGDIGGAARISAWSFGTATLESPGEKFRTTSTGGVEIPPDESETFNYIFGVIGFWELDLRYGLSEWAEIGGSIGFQRMGGEIRFALLDEDRRHPLSLAFSYGAYYSAIGAGPFMRAGFDVSKRWGRWAPMFNFYASRGAGYHSSTVDLPGDASCPEEQRAGLPCGVLIGARWYETRLTAGLGIAYARDERFAFVLGVTPHAIVEHTRPVRTKEARPDTLFHEAGMQIVLGAQVPGW